MALSKYRIFAGLYLALEKVLEPGDQLVTQGELGFPVDGLVLVDRVNKKSYVIEFMEVGLPDEGHQAPEAGDDAGEDAAAIREALDDCVPYSKAVFDRANNGCPRCRQHQHQPCTANREGPSHEGSK